MSWISDLFRPRASTKLAPSGDLSVPALQSVARGLCFNARASHGVDWTSTTITNTNSMLPVMDSNCVVLLERVPFTSLRSGDYVTYRTDWTPDRVNALHQITSQDRAGHWVISGLNNPTNDPQRVTPENFDRRVCGVLYGAKDSKTDN